MADKLTEPSVAGGVKQTNPDAKRSTPAAPNKVESKLEMDKSNKTSTNSADQVAGREGKGTVTGLLDKIRPGKKFDASDSDIQRASGGIY